MGEGTRAKYLVKWVGYPTWESSWEPASSLANAADAVAEYEHQLAARNLNSMKMIPHTRQVHRGNTLKIHTLSTMMPTSRTNLKETRPGP
jgi:hypothetical protein